MRLRPREMSHVVSPSLGAACGGSEWRVARRYNEFYELHAKVCDSVSDLPPLPAKT